MPDQGPAGAFFLPRMCDTTPVGKASLAPSTNEGGERKGLAGHSNPGPSHTEGSRTPVMSFQLQEPTRPFLVQPGLT